MRVLLFTGKGGVGTSTCAVATAATIAAAGRKTLLVATGAAGALGDVCGAALGRQPVELASGLYAAQIDSQLAFERGWGELQGLLRSAFEGAGSAPLDQAELALLPGADEILSLLEVQGQAESGRWDVVVVDCGPAAHSVRMLALPATLTWYLERLLPLPRKGLRGVSPLTRAAGATSRARAYEAIAGLHEQLRRLRDLLADASTTSVRLVVTPDAVAVAATLRTLTGLSLHGFDVDEVITNRVIEPTTGESPGPRVHRQRAQLARVDAAFSSRRVRAGPDRDVEPVGVGLLADLGRDLYGDDDPSAARTPVPAVRVDREGGTFILSLALPLVERDEVDLVRRGDDLVVTVQGQRRALTLPSALRRCTVTEAKLAGGRLSIEFAPDPDLWLRS